jgi:transposase
MRPPGSPEELERRRTRAVQLLEQGESPTVVGRIMGVSTRSLRRWRFLSHSEGLQAKAARGRRRRLCDEQLGRLETLLNEGAIAHGWCNPLWTAARVAVLIRRYFGIQYHPEHVRKLLKQRLHWTSQRPQKHARECKDPEVERWIGEEWPRIVRQARERGAHLALLDESGFLLAPVVRRTLAPRGKTPKLVCSDRHDRISVISAVTLSPTALRVGLHFMLLADNENFHAEEVVLFLRQLKGEIGGRWTVVWDRNKIHSRSLVVRAWLEEHPEVEGEDFPAHAPATNPDEGVWCWTKYGRLCNLAPADVAELRVYIWDALVALKHQPQLLTSFIVRAKLPLIFD